MGGIFERRELMKATAAGGVALSIGGAQSLLAANEAHAQGTSSRPGGWPNRRLLDLVKIDHPIIQAPMGGGHIGVISFHFGLPEKSLVDRLKAASCVILSSATTITEARWLEEHGVDAVIAQGIEAGGHRATFLTNEPASQLGTLVLVPQVVDAVKVPVIAAGGIADGRGIAAAFALGASAVQMGTAYLLCPEATISALHRAAIKSAKDQLSAISNVLTGRPARVLVNRIVREVGPLASDVPSFPLGAVALGPLRTKAESQGSADFSGLYAGEAAALCRELPAGELTLKLAAEALQRLDAPGRAG